MKNKKNVLLMIYILLLLSFLLNACTNNQGENSVDTSVPPTQPIVESTNQPTALPIEEPSNNDIYFFEENLPETQSYEIQEILQKYAIRNNLDFSVIDLLSVENLQNAKKVFIYERTDNWKQLAANLPDIEFLVISPQELDLPKNVIQIQTPNSELLFVAGYVSAILADDWRVGAILPSETNGGSTYSQIFSNGVKYLCGLCSPVYAPVVFFPTIATIGGTTDVNAINNAYGEIAVNRPNTIFLPSQYMIEDVVINLKQNGHIIISDFDVDPENYEFVDIQIGFDIAKTLSELLENTDKEVTVIKPSIFIQDKNSILSEGKYNYIQQLLMDINQGFVSPLSVSEQ